MNKSFDDESDLLSDVYDSDADPEYQPGNNNTNIYSSRLLQSLPLPLIGHWSMRLPILFDSSDDESFSESSSESNDDEPDDNNWMENYLHIPELDFCKDSVDN